jgi:hypothetical protein
MNKSYALVKEVEDEIKEIRSDMDEYNKVNLFIYD